MNKLKHIVVVDNKNNLVASITVDFDKKDFEIINNKEYDVRIEGISTYNKEVGNV